jgi:hypothetical protein
MQRAFQEIRATDEVPRTQTSETGPAAWVSSTFNTMPGSPFAYAQHD